MMKVVLESRYNWKTTQYGHLHMHTIGDDQPVDAVAALLRDSHEPSASDVGDILSQQIGHFAAIVESQDLILAFVDAIRSYPIFYAWNTENPVLSNSAHRAKEEGKIKTVDPVSLLEFSMAGYVTGQETIYKNLFQLQAGELLYWNKTRQDLVLERYYRYYPRETRHESEAALIDHLDEVTNQVFHRVVEKANGVPIWISLSGGLDSRLVTCKLKQLGYDRLMTFSYGMPGNHDAKTAEYVANKLGVPWTPVLFRRERAREFFRSPTRKEYWAFADGLCSIPGMQEFEALLALRERGKLPDDAVLINGQTGDFISGGHIPTSLMQGDPSVQKLLDAIINKHYSLWTHLKTEVNLAQIEEKILRILQCSRDEQLSTEQMVALYEYWEWQGRQSKYVVNMQRLYDFLNLAWQLPLWDMEFMRFWERVPLKQRFNQVLYRRYLEQFDYKGLFRGFNPNTSQWPGLTAMVPQVGRVIKLLFGQESKTQFYKYASYFGHYGNQYAMYGLRHFLKSIPKAQFPPQARGVVALTVETWLCENGLCEALEVSV